MEQVQGYITLHSGLFLGLAIILLIIIAVLILKKIRTLAIVLIVIVLVVAVFLYRSGAFNNFGVDDVNKIRTDAKKKVFEQIMKEQRR
ncbi:MAG TPA: hypothetical protein PKX12_14700 [Spirochaetota bacterium]|nr:hypothetical protein [Spirochaetota bacterium]